MGDLRGSSDRVPFDFDGSLSLARRLWALADQIDHGLNRRIEAANTARAQWRGPYRTDFDIRADAEWTSAAQIASGLREEAGGWADAWRAALEEQNRRNRAAQVTQLRNNRSWLERNVGDRFTGDDSEAQVSSCPEIPTPQPPNFLPTICESSF